MKRKKIMVCCIVIGLISFTACGNTSNSISARQANAKQQEGQAADMDIKDKKIESAYTVDVVDDLQITVPSEWVTQGQSYYKNGKAQVYIESFDFESEKLMKEFDYEDEKSCLKEFFYNGSEADEGIEYTKQKLVMPSYQFRMVADKYYKGCNGKAVENTEPI